MLDGKNIAILQLLQKNSRMTASEISELVDLSVPATAERIKKLTDSEYVEGFHTKLNTRKLGLDLNAFIAVDSASSDHYIEIIDEATKNKSVLECHSVTGEGSHLLKVCVKNSRELERLLTDIQAWPGVIRTHTMLVLSTFKETTEIDLNQVKKG